MSINDAALSSSNKSLSSTQLNTDNDNASILRSLYKLAVTDGPHSTLTRVTCQRKQKIGPQQVRLAMNITPQEYTGTKELHIG
jgi:hypothetical protein